MPKLERPDLVDQLKENNFGESAHQTEDDLRVESGGPLGVREKIGDTVPVKKRQFKKDSGKPNIRKVAEPEDNPHTFRYVDSESNIENPEEIILQGIAKRAKRRKETKRYFSIGGRRKKQQAKYQENVLIKKGQIPPPEQVWRHPSLEENNVDAHRQWVAKRQDQIKLRGASWPKVEEKKKLKK
ncbi:MAG: hypothetical protein WC858_00820 [Parcubacteria group bacterium]|jgi:hypothetical protein